MFRELYNRSNYVYARIRKALRIIRSMNKKIYYLSVQNNYSKLKIYHYFSDTIVDFGTKPPRNEHTCYIYQSVLNDINWY